MSSTASRIIKNTGWLYAKMGITMFVSLYSTRLILNGLGANDFGIYNIVGGVVAMLGFINATMATATQRFMNFSEGKGDLEQQKTIFNVSILIHTILSLIVGLTLIFVGFYFFDGIIKIPDERLSASKIVYASMVISTIFTVMTVPYDAVINAHENMRYFAAVGILESILKLSIAFVCVNTTSDKLILYGILMAIIPLITLSIMRIYCHYNYHECVFSPIRYFNKDIAKKMTSFAGWNFFGTMSGMVGNYGNGIVLNHFYGVTLNAALGIANQLYGQLLVFSNNLLKALNPVITKKEGAGERKQMIAMATTGCKYSFAVMAIFTLPFIIEMNYIQHLWLNKIPEWSVLFAQLQLVRGLIEQLTIAYGTAIGAEGRIANYNVMIFFVNFMPILLISFLFSIGFSPLYFYIVNISIFGILLSLVKVYYMNKNCGMSYIYFSRNLLLPSIVSFVIPLMLGYIPTFLLPESFLRLIIIAIISILTYIVIFYYVAMTENERTRLLSLITKYINKPHNISFK